MWFNFARKIITGKMWMPCPRYPFSLYTGKNISLCAFLALFSWFCTTGRHDRRTQYYRAIGAKQHLTPDQGDAKSTMIQYRRVRGEGGGGGRDATETWLGATKCFGSSRQFCQSSNNIGDPTNSTNTAMLPFLPQIEWLFLLKYPLRRIAAPAEKMLGVEQFNEFISSMSRRNARQGQRE